MSEMPEGYFNTALCPLCNELFSARAWYQGSGICPRCGKRIPHSCIINAFNQMQSYQLAKALQEERANDPHYVFE